MEKFTCPRRVENGMEDGPFVGAGKNLDTWDTRQLGRNPQCSYCGSIDPDSFLIRIKAGEELGITDKSYKAYLPGATMTKFYFQHLSKDQRTEFIRMLNAKEVTFGWPGHFTVLPYFIGVA